MPEIALEFAGRIAQAAGKPVAHLSPVGINKGYTPALRLLASFGDGSTAFAKVGSTPLTAGWLRAEQKTYEALRGPFMPRYLGWDDDGTTPILLIEDLSQGHWPPPWTTAQIGAVLDALPKVWESKVAHASRLVEIRSVFDGWQQVADNPVPFLSLQIASAAWLEAALPVLLAIDGARVVDGDALLHLDLRSDNMCIVEDRAIFVDWNAVCLGNPKLDLGAWLPSLQAEGGPLPETILPDGGEIAGIISGYFAARAGLPIIPDAPRVRQIQWVQLQTALPWAVRALGLPPLDGH